MEQLEAKQTFLSLHVVSGLLYAVSGSGRLGLLTTWHPQDNESAHVVAQGSSRSVLVKRAETKFYIESSK